MGPTIILDKSALQALSDLEVSFLSKHYCVVIAPVLISEILADLKKGSEGSGVWKREVSRLSKKLLLTEFFTNIHHSHLITSSLLGRHPPMTGVPVVPRVEGPATELRKKLLHNETVMRTMLTNWSKGIFSQRDEERALHWRQTLKELNLEKHKRELKPLLDAMPRFDNLKHLLSDFEQLLQNAGSPSGPREQAVVHSSSIARFMDQIGVRQILRDKVFAHWQDRGLPPLKLFAPYAYHCFKAYMMFLLGLVRGLVSTRHSNWIDLEYLYYLPFCMVFSSRDKFHETLCPLFLGEDQEFVHGDELKEDLKRIAAKWESMDPTDKRSHRVNCRSEPPVDQQSVTYRLWHQHHETIQVWVRSVGKPDEDAT